MKLYEKIIEAQPDTVQKEYKKLNKSVVGQIDSLMNLYMLPEPEKTEYRDDSQTLLSKLFMGRRFLSTSLGAPTENGKHAIETAQEASKAVLNGINEFFVDDWSKYIQKIKSLPMDIFKEYEEINRVVSKSFVLPMAEQRIDLYLDLVYS